MHPSCQAFCGAFRGRMRDIECAQPLRAVMCSSALVYVGQELDFINGVFCATLQVHRGSTMRSVCGKAEGQFKANLIVEHTWSDGWNANYEMNKVAGELLLFHNVNAGPAGTGDESARRHAPSLLLKWLPTLWVNGRLVRYCPYGCCGSVGESCKKIWTAVHGLHPLDL